VRASPILRLECDWRVRATGPTSMPVRTEPYQVYLSHESIVLHWLDMTLFWIVVAVVVDVVEGCCDTV